jgi:hypothetical protein
VLARELGANPHGGRARIPWQRRRGVAQPRAMIVDPTGVGHVVEYLEEGLKLADEDGIDIEAPFGRRRVS